MGTSSGVGRSTSPIRSTSIVIVLTVIILIGLAVVIAVMVGGAQPNTLRYELAKTAMQLVAVAGFASVATLAVQSFLEAGRDAVQVRRKEEQDAADQRRDADEKEQRAINRLVDARLRRDELMRSTLDLTVKTYNDVKSIRRRLRAATGYESTRPSSSVAHPTLITVGTYDAYLHDLIDQQLRFEELNRLAPLTRLKALPGLFQGIEEYLQPTIEEFERQRAHLARSEHGLAVEQLPRLDDLLSQASFYREVSQPVSEIVLTLQEALLEPVDVSVAVASSH